MLLSKQLILVFSLKYQRKKIWFEKVFKSQKNTVQTFLALLSLISHFEVPHTRTKLYSTRPHCTLNGTNRLCRIREGKYNHSFRPYLIDSSQKSSRESPDEGHSTWSHGHQDRHTAQRPFYEHNSSCTVCWRRFHWKYIWKMHLETPSILPITCRAIIPTKGSREFIVVEKEISFSSFLRIRCFCREWPHRSQRRTYLPGIHSIESNHQNHRILKYISSCSLQINRSSKIKTPYWIKSCCISNYSCWNHSSPLDNNKQSVKISNQFRLCLTLKKYHFLFFLKNRLLWMISTPNTPNYSSQDLGNGCIMSFSIAPMTDNFSYIMISMNFWSKWTFVYINALLRRWWA